MLLFFLSTHASVFLTSGYTIAYIGLARRPRSVQPSVGSGTTAPHHLPAPDTLIDKSSFFGVFLQLATVGLFRQLTMLSYVTLAEFVSCSNVTRFSVCECLVPVLVHPGSDKQWATMTTQCSKIVQIF